MSNDIDILKIHKDISLKFKEDMLNISKYREKLLELEKYTKMRTLNQKLDIKTSYNKLKTEIDDIQSQSTLNFYITESAYLISEYQKILKTPIKLNFIGKPIKSDKDKKKIISLYLEVAKRYIEIDYDHHSSKKQKIICDNCPNKKKFDIIDGNTYICLDCFSQQVVIIHTSSYKDIDRINISSKYTYDRKVHFRDCINQYQGKQNSTIEQKVYDDLEDEFRSHHLLVGNVDTKREERFKRINKEHIILFLKELDYAKHYENNILIHYNLTGQKPDDIGYLEDKLLDDFDALTNLYDKKFKNIDRKNFINTQYVLFQLLTRHKHPCIKEDFTILKTIDRKSFHDDICKILFEDLGWNHTPYF
jgi:hypothetical protein